MKRQPSPLDADGPGASEACAGDAGFVGRTTRFECGFRWRPEKWRDWIDADAGAHLSPKQDIHAWVETPTYVIDFSTGDAMGDPDDSWPPLVYRPKWRLPKHPREAKGAGTICCGAMPGDRGADKLRGAAAVANVAADRSGKPV